MSAPTMTSSEIPMRRSNALATARLEVVSASGAEDSAALIACPRRPNRTTTA